MLAGHYAPALLIKARFPDIRLWVLFLAVQAVDIVFFVFALTGIEVMSVVDARGPLAMQLEHVPLTHSLLMNGVFALACLSWGVVKKQARLGLLIGLALLSHWFLDVLVHLPDLPVVPWHEPKVGLGFWRYAYLSLALELLLILGAYWVTRRSVIPPAVRNYADMGAAALVCAQVSFVLGPTMPTVWAMAAMAEAVYIAFVLFALGLDRRLDAQRGLTPS